MRRRLLLDWMVIVGTASLLWAVNLGAQPDEIVLDDQSVFTSRSRPAVTFPHVQHIDAGIECTDCHHRFQNGENIEDEAELEEGAEGITCASCHQRESNFRFKPDLDPSKRTLQQAYHRMCIRCHRRVRKDDKKAGPVTCGGCHPKKGT